MSFGRFVCIYWIGYTVSVVVSACVAIAWLVLRYREAFFTIYFDYMSSPDRKTWFEYLIHTVCGVLFWPFETPRRAIRLVREVNETAKKYNL